MGERIERQRVVRPPDAGELLDGSESPRLRVGRSVDADEALPPLDESLAEGEIPSGWEEFVDWFVRYWQRRAEELWIPKS
jgi:hypothetical protein